MAIEALSHSVKISILREKIVILPILQDVNFDFW